MDVPGSALPQARRGPIAWLAPPLRAAVESGSLPVELIARIESVDARLPDLCGPEPKPTLLHGDAQGNNFLSTRDGAYAIDPAVYYGHPEMDLAAIDLWQPASAEVLAAYREEAPVAPDFTERRDLWRIPAYLGAVAVDGAAYLRPLANALRTYD